MAQIKKDAIKSSAEITKQTEIAKKETAFPIATLRNNSVKLFGCTSSTFDGAFFNVENKEYTVNEAKKIIESWLKKEVK